jgi:ER-Golgi trafficking TRAPP I complex 85 kDa subunit
LLSINSHDAEGDPVVPDIWSASVQETAAISSTINPALHDASFTEEEIKSPVLFHRASVVGAEARGSCLTQPDFDRVDDFISHLNKSVLDYMASQINLWEQNVASSRRGISGRFLKAGFKMFGAKAPTPPVSTFVDATTGQIMFHYSSPEIILRRLADYAFMVNQAYIG